LNNNNNNIKSIKYLDDVKDEDGDICCPDSLKPAENRYTTEKLKQKAI